ncbi:hypothetical protein HBI40_241290 [Parastagonospora nodorum]|nr:hypothetical protein HBH51_245330 [Parastagonospora nodorum]KAH6261338.1 hypothetical protein HBI40_241290 [Parastagonospora nodorum]
MGEHALDDDICVYNLLIAPFSDSFLDTVVADENPKSDLPRQQKNGLGKCTSAMDFSHEPGEDGDSESLAMMMMIVMRVYTHAKHPWQPKP